MHQKKWTVLLYFSADCNLASEMVAALREIHRVGSNDSFDVVIQLDGRPPRIFEVVANGSVPRNGSDAPYNILQRSANVIEGASSKQARLRDFIFKGIRDHPAECYMLVLSGHGKGAVGGFLQGESPSSLLGISPLDLRNVLEEVKSAFVADGWPSPSFAGNERLDIMGFDTCLGSMGEVAYELRNHINLMVGTESFTPNRGWPYDRLLKTILNEEGSQPSSATSLFDGSPKMLAKKLVRDYIKYYFDFALVDVSTDQAALDLSHIDNFCSTLRRLSERLQYALENSNSRDAIVLAHWEAQSYKDDFTDLWDFCDLLAARTKTLDIELCEACEGVRNAIENVVLLCCYAGPKFQHSHGLAVFFPWNETKDAEGGSEFEHYKKLSFADRTLWGDFLSAYAQRTRRQPRRSSINQLQRRKPMDDTINITMTKYDEDTRFNPDLGTKFDAESDPRSRTNSADPEVRGGPGARGGGMTNGPVEWYPCDGLDDDLQTIDVAMHSSNGAVGTDLHVKHPELPPVGSRAGTETSAKAGTETSAKDGEFTVKAGTETSAKDGVLAVRTPGATIRTPGATIRSGEFTGQDPNDRLGTALNARSA